MQLYSLQTTSSAVLRMLFIAPTHASWSAAFICSVMPCAWAIRSISSRSISFASRSISLRWCVSWPGFQIDIDCATVLLQILEPHPAKTSVCCRFTSMHKQIGDTKIFMLPISNFHCVTVLSRAWIWPLFWPFSGSSSIKQLDWLVPNFMISKLNIT